MKTKSTLPTVKPLMLAFAAVSAAWPTQAAPFDEIQFWAGQGTNRAALVIDWKSPQGPSAFLWGYRWDGAATGWDMFQAVVAADPFLFAHVSQFVWGTAILGIGYDLNQSGGFGTSPALAFDAQGLARNTGAEHANDARQPTDAADLYREGWNTGFWAYYLKASAEEDWASALSGADTRVLADGAWDGFSFAAGFLGTAPSAPRPAPVPEPGAGTFLLLAGLALLCARRHCT